MQDKIEKKGQQTTMISLGIGDIHYRTNSLLLGQIMEELERKIEKHGANKILAHLENA